MHSSEVRRGIAGERPTIGVCTHQRCVEALQARGLESVCALLRGAVRHCRRGLATERILIIVQLVEVDAQVGMLFTQRRRSRLEKKLKEQGRVLDRHDFGCMECVPEEKHQS